ncbi:MAG: nitroreductase family protein [bacterium]|nr:nitroreductase family protein [bacterium]
MSLDLIFSRRSIRRFTNEPVGMAEEKQLLQAAMAAPSANNFKPWHFIVIRKRETLDRIAAVHPYAGMLKEATLCLAVIGDPAVNGDYWILDCAAATQNILLAATALDLGSCWLGVHPREERKREIGELLGMPDEMEILSLVAIGHPAELKQPRTQFDAERVRQETW